MSDSATPAQLKREDLEAYLAKHGIRALLKDCLNSLLHELPEEPLSFIVDFVNQHKRDSTPYVDGPVTSDAALLRNEMGSASGGGLGLGGFTHVDTTSEESETEEDEEGDELGELGEARDFEEEERQKRMRIGSRRRGSVSSETVRLGDIDQANFPEHEKSAEQELIIFNILRNNILLKHLDSKPTQIITKAMFTKTAQPGECIITQGEEGDHFYVIESGSVDVYVKGMDALTDAAIEGDQTCEFGGRVTTYATGDAFGELALMYTAPRAATCRARTETTLWLVDRMTFRSMVMGMAVQKRMQRSGHLKNVKLLQTLTQQERETVMDVMEEVPFKKGATVIKQGDPGEKFYIVIEGECVVTIDEAGSTKEVGKIAVGGYFGEIALLTNQPRLATVAAVGPVSVMCISRKAFVRVMGPLKELLSRNMELHDSFIKM